MATNLIPRIPLVNHDLNNLGWLQFTRGSKCMQTPINEPRTIALKVANGASEYLLRNARETVRATPGQFYSPAAKLSLKLAEQVKYVDILITLIGQNLPPIQPRAIEKLTPTSFQELIHPEIAFWMSRELVNAQKPAIEGPAVTRIRPNPGKAEVDDKVPGLPAPGTAVCRVFRVQKQNLHTLWSLLTAAKLLWINYRSDQIDLRVMAVGSTP